MASLSGPNTEVLREFPFECQWEGEKNWLVALLGCEGLERQEGL